MKYSLLTTLLILATAAFAVAQEPKPAPDEAARAAPKLDPKPAPEAAPAAPKLDPTQLKDRASYFFGTDVANSFQTNVFELNVDLFIQGFKDTMEKKPGKFTKEELEAAVAQFQEEMRAKQSELANASSAKNADEGKKFLEENGKRKGVTTTESGLQYEVLKQGEGAKPKAEDTVTVNYQGTLLNGKEFDSSAKHGEPATFPLNRVIAGWTEGVQLMSVGSKYKFFIPAKLAYAERGAGEDIGPNSTLIFEVELLNVTPKQ